MGQRNETKIRKKTRHGQILRNFFSDSYHDMREKNLFTTGATIFHKADSDVDIGTTLKKLEMAYNAYQDIVTDSHRRMGNFQYEM